MVPKFRDRPMVVIEQMVTPELAFNTVNRTIDNITTTVVFFYCKPNTCREMAKEQ